MLTVQSAQPSHALRPFVRAYAQRSADIADAPIVEPVPARLEETLEFEFGDLFDVHFYDGSTLTSPPITVVGWQSGPRAEVHLFGAIECFAVFFRPAGFSRLFGVPMASLRNQAFEATSILGFEIRSLWNQLGEVQSFSDRVVIVEAFLRRHGQKIATADSAAASANRIFSLRGVVEIDDLAQDLGVSRRQFERRFLAQVGISAKSFARIARFQTALDLKVAQPRRTWLDIAHDLGYFDQMHLIHDFRKLGGQAPERLLESLGDMRPKALAASAQQYGEAGI